MALHLGAEHQLWLKLSHRALYREIIIGDQRFEPIFARQCPHIASALPTVGTQTNDFESHLIPRHSCSGQRMRTIGKNENPLARQVGRIDRAAIPGKAALSDRIRVDIQSQRLNHFSNKVTGRTPTKGYGGDCGLLELPS